MGFLPQVLRAAVILCPVALWLSWSYGRRLHIGWRQALISAALWIVASIPLTFLAAVYAKSLRQQWITGRWPILWDVTPSAVCEDAWNQTLGSVLHLLAGPFFLAPLVFPPLLLLARNTLSPRARWGIVVLFVVGWLLIFLEPGRRVAWWLD